MNMIGVNLTSRTLRAELANYFDSRLGARTDCNHRGRLDEWELAERLERQGDCSAPYLEYEKALTCPINKRREADCLMTCCPSNTFCKLLRREGYLK